MSTTIDESIPISDEDFEAQLTSALASLEGRSAAELTDEAIAKHLFQTSNDGSKPTFVTDAQTEFTTIKVIKVTTGGSSGPKADGATVCTYKCIEPRTRELMIYNSCNPFVDQWLGTSTGGLAYNVYSGSSRFVARNRVQIPGRPGQFLVVTFFEGDGGRQFAEVSLLPCVSLVL